MLSTQKSRKSISRKTLLIIAMVALNLSLATIVVAQNLLTANVSIPATVQFKVSSAVLSDTTTSPAVSSSCQVTRSAGTWMIDCTNLSFPIAQGDSLGLSVTLDNPSPSRQSTITLTTADTGIVFTSAFATTSGTTTNQCSPSTAVGQSVTCTLAIPSGAPAVNVVFGFTDNSVSSSSVPLTLTVQ